MPTLDFKGKQFIYSHHHVVPYRELVVDAKKSLSSDPNLDGNLIIHGDNLHGLKALLPRYAGKVKCIYIDPPYNTGNEGWCYNDKVNSPLMKTWLAKNANPVDKEDPERHDKWLCMMYPRLKLLHELLADDGVIFVSIDDNEVHNLRGIMDEIWGEENFVANLIWRKKAGGGQDSEHLAREHDYIVTYCKSSDFKMNYRKRVLLESEFKKEKNGRKCKYINLEKWGSNSLRTDRPTMYYPIQAPDGTDFYPQAPSGEEGNWRTKPTALDDDHIHWDWDKKRKKWQPKEVIYFDESDTTKIIKERTIFYDLATTTDATEEQKEIYNKKIFDNSKPVLLIYRLIQISTNSNDIILDSFGGTATTAHAVLDLNKEDGGNRQFILIECEDYADNITAERVRRVIKGVPTAKDEKLKAGLGGNFTFANLGGEFDIDKILDGESLPEYSALAQYVFYTATGQSLNKQAKQQKNFYVGETKSYQLYLIYKPDINFLRSNDSTLNYERATQIAEHKKSNKTKLVFATAKFMSQKDLSHYKITFCQLPHAIHRIGSK